MAQLKKTKKTNKYTKWFYIVFGLSFILFLAFLIYVISGLPPVEDLENPKPLLASNVWSYDGELIGQFFIENRVPIKYKDINQSVIKALIATEDVKFYKHWGVDIDRFVKAMIKTLMGKKQGASTITQQLAKNLYGLKDSNENIFETVVRKVREWITAVQIEKTYTKKEILELYLNISYFGNSAYGIQSAAKIYFNKNAKDLTVPEAATLIGLLKSSVYYDPIKRENNALQRRNLILTRLYEEGFISELELKNYKAMRINIDRQKLTKKFKSDIAPHFVEYVRQQMEKWAAEHNVNLYEDGLNIYTTLDSKMQRIANRAVNEHLSTFQPQFDKYWDWNKHPEILKDAVIRYIKDTEAYRKAKSDQEKEKILLEKRNDPNIIARVKEEKQKIEVGFVAIDPSNGQIRAMVGGRDTIRGMGINHAVQIKRQPGSSFKPIVYLTAINNGCYPAMALPNQPFNYKGWSPSNYEHDAGGLLTLRNALKLSKNIIAARLVIDGFATIDDIIDHAKRLGIKTPLQHYPSISLGTSEVSPVELVNAYATIANKGIYNEYISIVRITDKAGVVLEDFTNVINQAISPETAYIITSMLQTAIDNGTGAGARGTYNFRRPAAGKTGTTQNFKDAWFMGFTPQLAAGVWVGFDDSRMTFGGGYGQGARAAMPIWAIFMREVYKAFDLPVADFEKPEGVEVGEFCADELGANTPLSNGMCGNTFSDIYDINKKPGEFTINRNYKYINEMSGL